MEGWFRVEYLHAYSVLFCHDHWISPLVRKEKNNISGQLSVRDPGRREHNAPAVLEAQLLV